MHKLILLAIVVTALALVYWFMVRPVLAANPTLKPIFDELDGHEMTLRKVLWDYFDGLKTILFARLLMIAGPLATALDVFGSFPLGDLLPPKFAMYAGPMLMVIGLIVEWLRKQTTGPVDLAPAEPVKVDPKLDGPLPDKA